MVGERNNYDRFEFLRKTAEFKKKIYTELLTNLSIWDKSFPFLKNKWR